MLNELRVPRRGGNCTCKANWQKGNVSVAIRAIRGQKSVQFCGFSSTRLISPTTNRKLMTPSTACAATNQSAPL